MTRCSVQPRDRIFVKGYRFLSFASNVGRNLGHKYSQKLLDWATDPFKTASKRAIQKTVEATGDLTGNKIADKNFKILKIHHKINQKQIKKYLGENIYPWI